MTHDHLQLSLSVHLYSDAGCFEFIDSSHCHYQTHKVHQQDQADWQECSVVKGFIADEATKNPKSYTDSIENLEFLVFHKQSACSQETDEKF